MTTTVWTHNVITIRRVLYYILYYYIIIADLHWMQCYIPCTQREHTGAYLKGIKRLESFIV